MSHPYTTLTYAQTLSHIGEPIEVPERGCYVLGRRIDDCWADATGVYPISVLRPDADLVGGLSRLRERGLVSVVLVLDDVHRPSLAELKNAFGLVRSFKTHFIHRAGDIKHAFGKNHRYKISRAKRSVTTSVLDLSQEQQEWERLYRTLSIRHALSGQHAFAPDHVEALAASGGFEAIGAWHDGSLVSAHIWAVHEGAVHSHLVASSERGYALQAAYAVNAASLDHFSSATLVNLGGGAGVQGADGDGLARFKRGFANHEAPAYICGAVLRPDVYISLCDAARIADTSGFFPAYRTP